MEDRTADVGPGEGLEGHALAAAVQLRGPQQSQQAHLAQVVAGFGADAGVVDRDRLHQSDVALDPLVAALQGAGGGRGTPLAPGTGLGAAGLGMGTVRRHGGSG